jgi:hypothetical protein
MDIMLLDLPISVEFSYTRTFVHSQRGIRDVTFCTLYVQNRIVTTDHAIRHPGDRPNVETGRKVALGKALRRFVPEKNVRRHLWSQYLEQIQ